MAFNGRFILNIAHFAAQQGVDMEALIHLSGKTVEALSAADCQVDDLYYNAVMEKAIEASEDPFFGLHLGERQNLSAIGLIGQITQSCETVKQALEYSCHFANLGCSALPMSLVEERDHYKVIMTPVKLWEKQSPLSMQHTAEGVLAFAIREFHSLTREQHHPIQVNMPWSRPSDASEYSRVYGAPIYFGQNEIAILLQKKHVEEAVVTADYDLLRVLVAHAEAKSAQMEQQKRFADRIKQSVIQLVKPEFPSLEQVARHLNLSPRTLQRRLKEEDYTFKQLIDELKEEFALGYLRRPDLSISEVAYLLGYTDNSAFSRSFKRWTGKSPVEYRLVLQNNT